MAGPLIPRPSAWRRWRLALVAVVAVTAIHGCIALRVAAHLSALSAADEPEPDRMKAIYVRSMAAEDPPEAASMSAVARPAARPRPAPAAAMVQVAAASAARGREAEVQGDARERVADGPPEVARADSPRDDAVASAASASVASASMPQVPSAAASASSSPEVPASSASSSAMTTATAAASVPASASSPSRPPFEWPVATRVSYSLTGYYRGEVYGSAQVEWLRADDRYQVHLDVRVGFDAAPFLSRRMSSEGRITAQGLAPGRYDQHTKLAFSDPSRAVVRIDAENVWLANGQRRERPGGVQDSASQFIQLAWLFSTQPQMARPGATVELPLALPRTVERMRYDVSPPEVLQTPFGEVPVFRLTPRKVASAGGDMTVEMWIAPRYRHLPIRLKIRQDAETFVDLMITRPPELAAGP